MIETVATRIITILYPTASGLKGYTIFEKAHRPLWPHWAFFDGCHSKTTAATSFAP